MTQAMDILDTVADVYGIRLTETMTGGGCMALQARLETGHWIVATDEGLCGFRERIAFESGDEGYEPRHSDDLQALGWFIGVYEHDDEGDWMGGKEPLVDVVDYDAYAGDLPGMIGKALGRLVDVL
jgi:hypothetical protein